MNASQHDFFGNLSLRILKLTLLWWAISLYVFYWHTPYGGDPGIFGFIFFAVQLPAGMNLLGAVLGIAGLLRDQQRSRALKGLLGNLGLPLVAVGTLYLFSPFAHAHRQMYPRASTNSNALHMPQQAESGTVPASQQAGPPLAAQGLIAYWNFDACNAEDAGPFNNHGAIHGNPQCLDGVRGKALRFDGVDDYIVVPNADSLNPREQLSIAAWYRPFRSFAGNGDNAIVQKSYSVHEPPYYQYHLGVNGNAYWPDRVPRAQGSFQARVAVNGVPVLQGTENDFWKPGQWYCLASVFDGQTLKLYSDAKLIGQVRHPGPISIYTTPLTIAKAHNLDRTEVDYTPGDIDEIRMYARALSVQEVLQSCGYNKPSADDNRPSEMPLSAEVSPPATDGGVSVKAQSEILAPGQAWRENQTLVLRLKDGRLHKLQNREETGDHEARYYTFQTYLPDLHSYLILLSGSEWHGYLLVDEITGAETEIWGIPVLSPDRKRFVVESLDLEAGFVANGIQIWKEQSGGFISEYAEEYDWGPSDATWLNDHTIAVTMNMRTEDNQGAYREAVAYLSRDGKGRWHLDASAKGRWERIAGGSGVRLRTAPDRTSPVAARLSLGTVLTVTQLSSVTTQPGGQEDRWYWVETPDHLKGWVSGSQTLRFDKNRPEFAYREILQQRAHLSDPRNLPEELDLLMFIARILPNLDNADAEMVLPVLEQISRGWDVLCRADPDGQARLDAAYLLQKLKAVERTAAAKNALKQTLLVRIKALVEHCSSASPAVSAGEGKSEKTAAAGNYSVIHAQLEEGLSLAASAKVSVAEYYMAFGRFPADNAAAGLPKPEQLIGNYVTGITVEDGAIHIAFGNRVDKAVQGKTLSLQPAIVTANPGSPISWLCGYMPPVQGMAAQGKNMTSVTTMYLPLECRLP